MTGLVVPAHAGELALQRDCRPAVCVERDGGRHQFLRDGLVGRARDLLTDPEKTSFFFVTLPEALPIAVITRFIAWFKEFGIPVGGVVVNMLIDKKSLDANAADFVKNRVAMQDEHMKTVWQKFDGSVRAITSDTIVLMQDVNEVFAIREEG